MKKSQTMKSKLLLLAALALFAAPWASADDSSIETVASRAFAADYRSDCGPKGRSFTSVAETGVTITPATLNTLLNAVQPDLPFVGSEVAANGDLMMKFKGWRRWQKRIAKSQPIHARLLFGHEYTLMKITSEDFDFEFELADHSYNLSVDGVSNVKGWSATSNFDDLSRNGEYFDRFDVGWDSFLVRRDQPLREKILNETFAAACGKSAELADAKGAVADDAAVVKPASMAQSSQRVN